MLDRSSRFTPPTWRAFAVAIAVASAGLALTGAAFGSGSARTEHLRFMSTATPTGETFSTIATGAFTDGGTATLLSRRGTLKLRNGTIKVTQRPGKPVVRANTKMCYETLSQKGTYKIVGGTGTYKGIAGSGNYTLRFREFGRLLHAKCDTKSTKLSAAQAIITASGPVRVG